MNPLQRFTGLREECECIQQLSRVGRCLYLILRHAHTYSSKSRTTGDSLAKCPRRQTCAS